MQKRDAILDIEYSKKFHAYKVSLWNFRYKLLDGSWETPAIYIEPDKMPDEFKNEKQKFQVGDLVDKVYHENHGNYFYGPEKQHREFCGKIIDVKKKDDRDNSPTQFIYTIDDIGSNFYPRHPTDYKQWELELAVNPPTD